jgi:hypothetical protein
MNPKKYAESLVNQFKVVLMDADTNCGNEILCTMIAIKNSLICIDRMIESRPQRPNEYSSTIEYYQEVKQELLKM